MLSKGSGSAIHQDAYNYSFLEISIASYGRRKAYRLPVQARHAIIRILISRGYLILLDIDILIC